MGNLKIGDLVARESYNRDILFKVVDIIKRPGKPDQVLLKGVSLRIIADSPAQDLYRVPLNQVEDFKGSFDKKADKVVKKILKERKEKNIASGNMMRSLPPHMKGGIPFGRSGRVLHLDGDGEYLDICLKTYKELEIEAVGKQIPEREQSKVIEDLLRDYAPDILVITGHDGLLKGYKDFANIHNYRNSNHFIETVKAARKYEPNMDDLVIFAGACQSHYEGILSSGANFASSPHRILMECRE